MEMSYRRAWDLVESMNRQASALFVETATGGKGGGGARITEAGEQAVSFFWEFHQDFQDFLNREGSRLEHYTSLQKRRKKK